MGERIEAGDWAVGPALRASAMRERVLSGFLALAMAAGSSQQPWLWARLALGPAPSAFPAPSGPKLAQLPIELVEGQSHRDLAKRLAPRDTFMALAVGVESLPERAYVDAAGANAGAGYCVELRRKALGDALVRSELGRAGFSPSDIAKLMSRERASVESVSVDASQALRLLVIAKPQYQAMARDAVGAKAFDAMPAHKRDVISYLAYNTGAPKTFVKLLRAARSGDDREALAQLAPSVELPSGKRLKNHRLRAWAQAAWIGPAELGRALARPVAFESVYAGEAGQFKFIAAHVAQLAAKLRGAAKKSVHALSAGSLAHHGHAAHGAHGSHAPGGHGHGAPAAPLPGLPARLAQASRHAEEPPRAKPSRG